MPVLEATDKIAPKSILRHRPIGDSSLISGNVISPRTSAVSRATRASRSPLTHSADVAEQVMEWKRISTKEAQKTPLPAASDRIASVSMTGNPRKTTRATLPPAKPLVTSPKSLVQFHPLLYLGAGMIAMLFLWIGLSAILNWASTTIDDLRYGSPRTFQMDYWVGHNEQTGMPSHFIALNLNRHIHVIEISGGDSAHTHIYVGPQLYGVNDNLVPVTLTFIDVNRDHKPDMILNFQGTHAVFINDQGAFRPMQQSEHDQIESFLTHYLE